MSIEAYKYIRIDVNNMFDPPIIIKDKNEIYSYKIEDGMLWIYDTCNGCTVFGINLSQVKAIWFEEEPYLTGGIKG